MGKPIWVTKAGNLGTIQEQTFYQLTMEGYDPDGGTLTYKIVAGQLPPGLVMYETGIITGQPKELYFIRGVPFDVKEDVTSTFCCRLTSSTTGQITDRTFSLTVTGEDPPEIITPDQELARVMDGSYVEIQLDAIDLDLEPISWALTSGALPNGLSLDSSTGLISGFVGPEFNLSVNLAGWSTDDALWEEYPWDFGSVAISKSYQFAIQITDGKTYDGARYTIYVYAHDAMTTDNDNITADITTPMRADTDDKINPILLTPSADLGTYAHDNYFAYKFDAVDYDGDVISYSLLVGDNIGFDNEINGFDSTLLDSSDLMLPPGLTMNTDTGWLYGQISRVTAGQTEYQFGVKVYKRDYPTYMSRLTVFSITIVNDLRYLITWNTDPDLGVIESGSISEKYVSASNLIGRTLQYELVFETGTNTHLPQGLKLNNDGLIVGRPSFELTSFDQSTTTFDSDVRELGALLDECTFDRQYTFKIKVSDADGELVAFRTFTLKVIPSSFGPYDSLYLKAMPGISDKEVLRQLLENTDLLPPNILYRKSDPNFGKSRDLRFLLLAGLTASSDYEYVSAMYTNHYRRILTLGEYKTYRALDADGNHVYDVVYIEILDGGMEGSTISTPVSIDLSKKINRDTSVDNTIVGMDNMLVTLDGKGDKIAYPSTLLSMRKVLRDRLGLAVREPLPRWMESKQADGRIPGWVAAVPIAYVKPGEGIKVIFNLNRLTDIDIKQVSFDIDGYILDNNLSRNYDTSTNSYVESNVTSFDAFTEPPDDPVGIVDFAVTVPFSMIDGASSESITQLLGGLDGIIGVYDGKRIIFAVQEAYPGYILEYDGWVRYPSSWDSAAGWDDPTAGWDEYEIIPGYAEAYDGSTQNQRSGIWLINQDENGVLHLELETTVDPGDLVRVESGFTYGGFIMQYVPVPLYFQGDTVPRYIKYLEYDERPETTFDAAKTRFVDNISIYQDPDEGDKYLIFPRENLWA